MSGIPAPQRNVATIRNIGFIQVKPKNDRESHTDMMNRGASELHATQQCVLANEAQAGHTAQQATIDAANI
jgi:hypothetical protein